MSNPLHAALESYAQTQGVLTAEQRRKFESGFLSAVRRDTNTAPESTEERVFFYAGYEAACRSADSLPLTAFSLAVERLRQYITYHDTRPTRRASDRAYMLNTGEPLAGEGLLNDIRVVLAGLEREPARYEMRRIGEQDWVTADAAEYAAHKDSPFVEFHLLYDAPKLSLEGLHTILEKMAERHDSKDAGRYTKLVASGNYAPSSTNNGWALRGGGDPCTKVELDAAVDLMPDVEAL